VLANATFTFTIPGSASTFFMGLHQAGRNRSLIYPHGVAWEWSSNTNGGENQLWTGSTDAGKVCIFTAGSAVLGLGSSGCDCCTVRVFRRNSALEGAIEFHALAPVEALPCVTNGIHLGCSPHLTGWHRKSCRNTEGLRIKFKGEDPDWESPLHFQSVVPPTWGGDGGAGTITAYPVGDDLVVTAAAGAVTVPVVGDGAVFRFDLLITPVKPLNTPRHFRRDRYYQYGYNGLADPTSIAAMGVEILNLHQGVMLNPYINYPFNHDAMVWCLRFEQNIEFEDNCLLVIRG
jgi:hypothetical protein